MLKAILFDFDGVIVNSDKHSLYCFQKSFEHFHLLKPSFADIMKYNGHTVINMLKYLLPNADDEQLNQLHEEYKKVSDESFTMIELMPGVEEVISNIGVKYKLAIVSSRRTISLHKLLLHHELNNYFLIVVGREDVQNHKPHPEGIEKALAAIEVKPSEAIFIGDAEQDVHAAKNAGMPCVLINENDNIHQAKYHIKSIAELPGLIKKLYER